MMYTIPATPTWYQETLFDSFLEARWAAMFTRLNWKWDYHRYCFDSSMGLRLNEPPYTNVIWVPDFALGTDIPNTHKGTIAALVEVKPWLVWEGFSDALDKTQEALLKCAPSNPKARNILFLGNNNRICFGNGEATGDQAWMDDVDNVAQCLRLEDSWWEETLEVLGEGL